MTPELTERLQSGFGASYRIERQLGGGGMSYVFVADETALGRKVAVKVLRPDLAAEISTERFKREILLAARLQHPHIVPVLTAGEIAGLPYYTMPFVEGESLEARLAREGPLRIRDAARLLAGVARALAYAHRQGVVHRDIKPSNVLIVDGTAVVTDFGIAKALLRARASEDVSDSGADRLALTQIGTAIGTPPYMAPEQITADPTTDHRADIYAFGVVAFEAIAGRRPFLGNSYQTLVVAHLSEVPPPLDELRDDVPGELAHLVAHCLEKDRERRPASADELVGPLEALAAADAPLVTGSRFAVPEIADAATTTPLSSEVVAKRPIVGRVADQRELAASFATATRERGLVHAVSGEAGFGKTTLVEHFLSTLGAERGRCRIGRGRCSERLAGTEAYLPFLEAIEGLFRGRGGALVAHEMRALAPAWYAQVHPFSPSDPTAVRTPPEPRASSSEQMKRQLAALLTELSRTAPLVLALEDVHWADASTVDLIGYLADRFDATRMLLLVTYRASDLLVSRHPFAELRLILQSRDAFRETKLSGFDERELTEYVDGAFPHHAFPPEFIRLVHARTEGTPLFVVDLLRQLADRGVIHDESGVWRLEQSIESVEQELPASIRSVIQRTVDRLDEADRRLLVAASIQGAEFDSAVIAGAIEMDSAEVEERLDRLDRVHGIVRLVDERVLGRRTPSLRYAFSHILYQNTLHATLRATRRVAMSVAVADAMYASYGDDPAQASQLGVLRTAARQFDEAARCFLRATQNATRLFASKEAVLLARRGLEAVEMLPQGKDRAAIEIELQLALGVPLTDLYGYTADDVERAYSRARELCAQLGDTPNLVPVLHGLYRFYTVRGRLHTARDVVEQLIAIAERTGDPKQIFVARAAMGPPLIHLGELEAAVEYLRRGMAAYDAGFDRLTYGAFMPEAWLAVAQWLLGHDAEALAANAMAREMAERQKNPFAAAYAEALTAWLHQYRGDAALVKQHAEACLEIARTNDYRQWLALGAMFQAWALVVLGEEERGLAQLSGAIDAFCRTGAELNLPHFQALLADAYLRTGNVASGLDTIDRALGVAEKNGDRVWEPELHRLRGALLLENGDRQGAITAFERAIAVAESQKSRSLEVRARESLVQLRNSI
jgi:predicted ATPase/tRNA A-37 threonylcarbamoyl transferase component Bud32